MLGISKTALRRLEKSGDITSVRIGRRLLFRRSEVQRFIDDKRTGAGSLTMPRIPIHKKSGMGHGIYCRRHAHGVTWYIRYFVGGREVKERLGRDADGFTKTLA